MARSSMLLILCMIALLKIELQIAMAENEPLDPIPRNCKDLQKSGHVSGVHTIFPYDSTPLRPVEVYCDMETDGGGWTVIQRRDNLQTRENFYRVWMEYVLGFGNLTGEFWLGLDHIHALTHQTLIEVRFDLTDADDIIRWAKYAYFYVYDESRSYLLEVDDYSGNAGDSFTFHHLQKFSTHDKDLDASSGNCAEDCINMAKSLKLLILCMISLLKIELQIAKAEDETLEPVQRNCKDLQKSGHESGVYTIFPYDSTPSRPVEVYCDMETDGGGWTVIQRRDDLETREKFYRSWMEYALGFGNLTGEFWLGLDNIHALTDQTLNEVRFDLTDADDISRWANYAFFYVQERSQSYLLEVDEYSGDAGDSFTYHHLHKFSTHDKDLDAASGNCAEVYLGAWWYKNCYESNLNGYQYIGSTESFQGIAWKSWHGLGYSLKRTEMKIRPAY